MNIHSPQSVFMKLASTAFLTTILASTAFAGDITTAPMTQFNVSTNVSGIIGSAATAFERGDFAKSASFSRYALKQGLRKSKKAKAYSNLCAALGAQGQYESAVEACSSAIKIAPTNWQAYENRAAAYWLSGKKVEAKADMETANKKTILG